MKGVFLGLLTLVVSASSVAGAEYHRSPPARRGNSPSYRNQQRYEARHREEYHRHHDDRDSYYHDPDRYYHDPDRYYHDPDRYHHHPDRYYHDRGGYYPNRGYYPPGHYGRYNGGWGGGQIIIDRPNARVGITVPRSGRGGSVRIQTGFGSFGFRL